jgi:hypothetical protein
MRSDERSSPPVQVIRRRRRTGPEEGAGSAPGAGRGSYDESGDYGSRYRDVPSKPTSRSRRKP